MDFNLQPFQKNDLKNLVKYANNFDIAKNLTDKFPHPYTKENGEFFINKVLADNPIQVKAIEIDGNFAGAVGLHLQEDVRRKSLEIGYWLGEPFWGNGIASRVVKEMVKYGFENFDCNRIFGRVFGNNLASQKVLQKAGFKLEGNLKDAVFKNGEFQDEIVFAILKKG